jgi:hypothetical protein
VFLFKITTITVDDTVKFYDKPTITGQACNSFTHDRQRFDTAGLRLAAIN